MGDTDWDAAADELKAQVDNHGTASHEAIKAGDYDESEKQWKLANAARRKLVLHLEHIRSL